MGQLTEQEFLLSLDLKLVIVLYRVSKVTVSPISSTVVSLKGFWWYCVWWVGLSCWTRGAHREQGPSVCRMLVPMLRRADMGPFRRVGWLDPNP